MATTIKSDATFEVDKNSAYFAIYEVANDWTTDLPVRGMPADPRLPGGDRPRFA